MSTPQDSGGRDLEDHRFRVRDAGRSLDGPAPNPQLFRLTDEDGFKKVALASGPTLPDSAPALA